MKFETFNYAKEYYGQRLVNILREGEQEPLAFLGIYPETGRPIFFFLGKALGDQEVFAILGEEFEVLTTTYLPTKKKAHLLYVPAETPPKETCFDQQAWFEEVPVNFTGDVIAIIAVR
jgi:hypothetical protein